MTTFFFKTRIVFGISAFLISVFFFGCSIKQAENVTPAEVSFTVTSFSPTSAVVGSLITINGTGFGTEMATIKVRFGISMPVKPASLSNDQITVRVPYDATSGKISIDQTGAGTAISETNFTVQPDLNDYASFNN